VIIICGVHFAWVYWNQLRSEEDRVEMLNLKDEAEFLLVGKSRYSPATKHNFLQQPACYFQVGTGWLIGLFSIVVRSCGAA
jgi:hypothetical protein